MLGFVDCPAARCQERAAPKPEVHGQEDSSRHASPDSLKGVPPDSTRRMIPDSLVHYFLPSLPGSLNRRMDTLDVITDTLMEWMSVRTLNQVIAGRPGIFGSDPSSLGQYFPLTIRGAGLRANTVLVDGREMADPASGIYNLSLFPMEMAERIEVVTGPRSFLYGTGSAGGTVNIVTRTASHRVPFTKIRYEEAAYDHNFSDGSFNQNLTRRSNLSFGYQYLGTGLRFYNSAHEQWNIRGALRYHLLPNISMVLSEHYAQTQTGLYGGINYLKTGFSLSFEPTFAQVYSKVAYEKLTRHDVDLRCVGMLLPDSTELTTVGVYYSANLREYRDIATDGSHTIEQDQRSSWMGIRVQQSASLGWHHLSAGINCEIRQVEGSPTLGRLRKMSVSTWAMDEMDISESIRLAAYGRSEAFQGEHYSGFGGDVSVTLGNGLSFHGGASIADRAPTYPELFWSDSSVTRNGTISAEKHYLLEAGLNWAPAGPDFVRLTLAHRTITDPILTAPYDGTGSAPQVYLYQGGTLRTLSAELAMQLRFFRYVLVEGTGTYLLRQDGSGTTMTDYPHFWGDGGIYLAGKLLSGSLDLKAGVHGRIATRYNGYYFSPQALFTVPNAVVTLGMASTLDLLAVAHIGSAYVHIMWENVTSTRYFSSPFTPALERAVRFGISWEFLN
jgi:outer membrane receptor protein involved in Fe transport